MIAKDHLECSRYDIENTFTESHLKEEIYFSPPVCVPVRKGYALQALRSLYRLKQAARNWNILCKNHLINWGFVPNLADPCPFTQKERHIELLVYIDDIAAAAKTKYALDWFFEKLSSRFNS